MAVHRNLLAEGLVAHQSKASIGINCSDILPIIVVASMSWVSIEVRGLHVKHCRSCVRPSPLDSDVLGISGRSMEVRLRRTDPCDAVHRYAIGCCVSADDVALEIGVAIDGGLKVLIAYCYLVEGLHRLIACGLHTNRYSIQRNTKTS